MNSAIYEIFFTNIGSLSKKLIQREEKKKAQHKININMARKRYTTKFITFGVRG